MLLAIAFAHAPLFITSIDRGPVIANDVVTFFHLLFVNNHARPMFAFLFGYGMVQLLNRRGEWVPTRKLLRRRGWWLVVIGVVHTAILAPIDILAMYGIAAILVVGLLRRRDATLLWSAGATMLASTVMAGLAMWAALLQAPSVIAAGSVAAGTTGPLELFLNRLAIWPIMLPIGILLVVPGMLFGMWAARRRILDEPARHRRFLVKASVITTVISVVGALPVALMDIDVWAKPSGLPLFAVALAQPLTGYLGGIGMAGIIALISLKVSSGPLTTAVQALGQRSMSLYLFQSVVFVAVFYPYGFSLQDDLGLAGATAVAAATWLASLLLADLMRRRGYRGPGETLLRRLSSREPKPAEMVQTVGGQ